VRNIAYDPRVPAPRAASTLSDRPLAGVRILAVEQMQAVPFATQLLAHLGAEVVKVEHPVHGEAGRTAQPAIRDDDGHDVGATYLRNNLGKKSIGVDLKDPRGVELVKRLVPHYDVIAENFKPGTMERLGLGYDALAADHPALVYVSVSGFGGLLPTPYGAWPAYAVVAEAMGGFYSFRPEPGRLPNIGVAGALGDIGSALFAAIGTLAALEGRRRTGRGQRVDVAMFDAMLPIMDMVLFNPSIGIRDNSLAAWPGICTSFAASDGLFVVQVGREHQFERFARAVGHPEWLGDARFATREGWSRHLDEVIRPAVEAWARERTKLEASRVLAEQGIVAGPSNDAADLLRDPHVRAHGMVIEVPRPDGGAPLHVAGNPIKLSGSAETLAQRWPRLGEHTDEILTRDLALSASERTALREAGVIG
jgi:crotonobetainyl-CoA:carnitine CoA-transferase CaiB-like acyl-CoA transferase